MATMSKQKGDRRERMAEAIYEDAGFRTWRPARSRAGKNDVWGLYDMLALGPKGVDCVQVKSNRAEGVEAFCAETAEFQRVPGLSPLMLVCYDGSNQHDPPTWRVIIPTGPDDRLTVVDEREDGTPPDGAGVRAWLDDPREGPEG